jgi:lipoprotein-anchoring transpeptidase ErfK/SrfK
VTAPDPAIDIDLSAQRLVLRRGGQLCLDVPVSTGINGISEINGSGGTPRGAHVIRAMIGRGLPRGAVFRARRWTGEIWTPEAHAAEPGRDWILTRILWLSGSEPGRNRLGCVDTFRRYIYLHGTPPVTALGVPGSKGCVRMDNDAIIDLFNQITPGTPVQLHA